MKVSEKCLNTWGFQKPSTTIVQIFGMIIDAKISHIQYTNFVNICNLENICCRRLIIQTR